MKNNNFELENFAKELNATVIATANAIESGAIREDVLTEILLTDLESDGEIESFVTISDIKEDKIGRKLHKINGYYLTENSEELDLFTTLYYGSSEISSASKSDVEKAASLATKFIENCFKKYYLDTDESSRIREISKNIFLSKDDVSRINIYILTDGISALENVPSFKINDCTINYHLWDLERFFRLWTSSNSREPICINFKETWGKGIPCLKAPSNNDDYDCFLAILDGEILASLYKNYGFRLLEHNVRAFLQNTGKVNKSIKATIQSDPHMFLAYNNGIAVTARGIELENGAPDGQILIKSINDFQIVNGGQTTASIFYAQRKHKIDVSNISVQMKLSIIKNEEKSNDIISLISRSANSQNKVSEVDLSSNAPFHRKLEELSRSIWAPDSANMNKETRWFFERIRGQYREELNKELKKSSQQAFEAKNPKKQVFKKEELAKFIIAWDLAPWQVARGGQKAYLYFMKTLKDKELPDNIYFEDTIAKMILFKAAERLYGIGNKAIGDYRFLVVPYSLSLINKLTFGKISLYKIWKKQSVSGELEKLIKTTLSFVNSFIREKAPQGLISEWAKKEDCWDALLEERYSIDSRKIESDLKSENEIDERTSSSSMFKDEIRQEIIDTINKLDISFWHGLYEWGRETRNLSMVQLNSAESIKKKIECNLNFNDTDLRRALELIQLVKNAKNISVEYIKSLA